MELVETKNSLDSELFFDTIFSIVIRQILKVLTNFRPLKNYKEFQWTMVGFKYKGAKFYGDFDQKYWVELFSHSFLT